MIRRNATGFRALLIAADALTAVALLVGLSLLRFGDDWASLWRQIVPIPEGLLVIFAGGWVVALAMNGRKLSGTVADGLGPIARIEVSIAGSDEWRPVFPSDGIFDEATESFDADLAALVPPGSHILAVRAYDTAGNMVSRDVEAR